jgi:hypothetical protein
MANIDTQHNEFVFITRIMIGMVLLSLVTILTAALLQVPNTIPCGYGNNDVSCQLANVQGQINSTTYSLSTAFNNVNDTPFKPANVSQTNPGLLGISAAEARVVNTLIIIPNFIYAIGTFIVSGMLLIIQLLGLILFVMTSLIPSIFADAHIGIFTPIFDILYAATVLIVIGYIGYLVVNRIQNMRIG